MFSSERALRSGSISITLIQRSDPVWSGPWGDLRPPSWRRPVLHPHIFIASFKTSVPDYLTGVWGTSGQVVAPPAPSRRGWWSMKSMRCFLLRVCGGSRQVSLWTVGYSGCTPEAVFPSSPLGVRCSLRQCTEYNPNLDQDQNSESGSAFWSLVYWLVLLFLLLLLLLLFLFVVVFWAASPDELVAHLRGFSPWRR